MQFKFEYDWIIWPEQSVAAVDSGLEVVYPVGQAVQVASFPVTV